VTPAGSALVGAACGRGHVGLFSSSDGTWQPDVVALQGAWHHAVTTVLRLQAASTQPTALVLASEGGHRALFVVTDEGGGHWKVSSPLELGADSAVRASAVDNGAFSVLVGSKRSPSVAGVNTDGSWTSFPAPPKDTLGLAWVAPGSVTFGGPALDAFTVVDGTELHVFTLTPAGTKWVPVQTLQVPLAYGSSG
jgi:hypothetical protein